MQNACDLERFGLGTIYDQVRVNREKFNIFVGQILAHMPSAGSLGEKPDPVTDNGLNMVCNRSVGLFSDVMSDFDKIKRRFRCKHIAHAHSGLAFSFAR